MQSDLTRVLNGVGNGKRLLCPSSNGNLKLGLGVRCLSDDLLIYSGIVVSNSKSSI